MDGLRELFSSDLPIPLWQIVFYMGLVSYFMVQRWFKLSFLTSFALVLYWLHYAFRADLVAITSEAHLARAIYYVLGFALILLSIFALTFLEVDADSVLAKREKEITLLRAQAKNAEKTAASLKAQLETDQTHNSTPKKKLEKKLNAKIEKLEHGLNEAESLLAQRDGEISELRAAVAEAQKSASASEALLEIYQNQEANSKKQLEQELSVKHEALEQQLGAAQDLLEQRNAEISSLQARASEAETNLSTVKIQLENGRATDSPLTRKLERDLNNEIATLKDKLEQGETLLENRNAEIAALRAKAAEAETHATGLKAQLEKEQFQVSAASKKLEEELISKIDTLGNQLRERDTLLEQRNAEVAAFKAQAAAADQQVLGLKAQLERDHSLGSTSKKKLEEKLNSKIAQLENQLKQGETLIEKRNTEIAELRARASDAESSAAALKADLQKQETQGASNNKQLEEELNATIAQLQNRLTQSESLLETRSREIADLQAKSSDAENAAAALKAQLEKDHTGDFAAAKRLERELNAKIANLEDRLTQSETLLENRNAEITALKGKASEAQESGARLQAQFDNEKAELIASKGKLQEEFSSSISKLEDQLKQGEILIEKRNAEIADLRLQAAEADKKASAFAAQLEKANNQASAVSRKLQEELNPQIANLEKQLKETQATLEKRNAEIASLQAKVSEEEKHASTHKAQLHPSPNKKLEEELKSKIVKLESQLKQSETLLEKRNGEIADLKFKAPQGDRKTATAKANAPAKRQSGEAEHPDNAAEEDVRKKLHQFQYAVKYLEDEIKEKDRLLSLMAKKTTQSQVSTKSALDEDSKKKIHQLEQAVKYLENQGKEKDGLLSLMAKRNRELADLKLKVEEQLEALQAGIDGTEKEKVSQPDIGSER